MEQSGAQSDKQYNPRISFIAGSKLRDPIEGSGVKRKGAGRSETSSSQEYVHFERQTPFVFSNRPPPSQQGKRGHSSVFGKLGEILRRNFCQPYCCIRSTRCDEEFNQTTTNVHRIMRPSLQKEIELVPCIMYVFSPYYS